MIEIVQLHKNVLTKVEPLGFIEGSRRL
jgi:hypothetical protein